MNRYLNTSLAARRLRAALDAPAGWSALDAPSEPLRRAIAALPLGPSRDILYGVWLGHPLHPALVQLPVGCWMSAGVLDLTRSERRAARRLVATGLGAAVPAALAGWVDWAKLDPPRQRTGLVHALANSAGVVLYGASLLARLRGRELRGRALGFAGLLSVSGGAALGGHLAHHQAAGVNRSAAVPRLADADWCVLGAVDDFPVGTLTRRMAGELAVVVARTAEGFAVLADRCSHLSGPLSGGELTDGALTGDALTGDERADDHPTAGPATAGPATTTSPTAPQPTAGPTPVGCVRCPWHGSEFRLRDGQVMHGPAVAPQPVFETRVLSGHLEVRLPYAG